MRISDWSSDVCSSDLPLLVDELGETLLDPFATFPPQGQVNGELVNDRLGLKHMLIKFHDAFSIANERAQFADGFFQCRLVERALPLLFGFALGDFLIGDRNSVV